MLSYERPMLLVVEDESQLNWISWHFGYVGLTDFAGYLTVGMKDWENAGLPIETLPQISVRELEGRREHFQLLDVRLIKCIMCLAA